MTQHDIELLDGWLSRPWPVGLILVAGCGSDGTPFCHALAEHTAAQVDHECWPTLNEAIAQLDAYGCSSHNSVWVFETAILCVARAPDGGWAGVLAPRGLSENLEREMKARLAEFASLAHRMQHPEVESHAAVPVA
jgi:hypothetical protein